jgi:hypothetical protein
MKYCVYRQWHDSRLQDVLEYFPSVKEAQKFARKIPPSNEYTVLIGEFV